jgi:uncharacterized protein (DUF305 family)
MKWPSRWRKITIVRAAGILVVTAAAALAVAAATGSGTDRPAGDTATPSSTVRVIMPGRPGEPAVVASGRVPVAVTPGYTPADVTFIRMMIPHHLQAARMADLVPARTGNKQVLAVAGRVRAAQLAEVGYLRSWLRARGLPENDGHPDHIGMRGMQTAAAMSALAADRDGAFDRRFVAMMSAHHQGAIEMATNALAVLHDVTVQELAKSIAAEQSIEIRRMHEAIGGER